MLLLEYISGLLLTDELNKHSDCHATYIANEVIAQLFSLSDTRPACEPAAVPGGLYQPVIESHASYRESQGSPRSGIVSLYVKAARTV